MPLDSKYIYGMFQEGRKKLKRTNTLVHILLKQVF